MLLLVVGISLMLSINSTFCQDSNEGIAFGGMSHVREIPDVSDQYFVVFNSAPGLTDRDMVLNAGASILYQYSIIPAFAVRVPSSAVINTIRQNSRVRYVEPVQVYYALGTEGDPELTDPANDHSLIGNATQDILKAWIEQGCNNDLIFHLKVQNLSAVNPTTGDGLPLNGIWKMNFTLQKPGQAAADIYFVEMRRGETGPPAFNYGYVSNISFTAGPVDEGAIIPDQGLIRWRVSRSKFTGAPNGNAFPQPGDVLTAIFAQTQQLIGAAGTGALAQIDRGPNTGSGRNFTIQPSALAFSPSSLSYGSVVVGQSKSLTIQVTNSGTSTVSISSVASSSAEFTVTPSSVTLLPSAGQTFTVSFQPASAGLKSAALTFTYDAACSPTVVQMTGEGANISQPPPPQAEVHPYGIDTVRAPQVWPTTKGAGVKVAVLDTGIDSLHYELDARYKGGYDFVNNDPYPWDGHSHGTHVSGTIAAELNNVGVIGVAPEVDLYALKVLSDAGTGSSAGILAAIDWCVRNGIKVANMSLGGGLGITSPTGHAARVPVYSPTEELAYQNAYDAGLLIIAASGNDGQPTVMYPAAYRAPMAVGSVDQRLIRATTSNYGADLEIVAPGVEVKSTVPRGTGSDARVLRGQQSFDAIEFAFSPKTSASGITRPAVNCGKGLQASDFPAAVAGNIALIQRGDSSFASKVRKAQDAGAVAVIIYNNVFGNFNGTLGTDRDLVRNRDWAPAVSLSQADGEALAASGTQTVTMINVSGDFNIYSGTSMATPHVAGVAALCFAVNPQLTNQQVRDILNSTVTDLSLPGYDPEYGNGLVNAAAAVAMAAATPPPPPVVTEGTISPQDTSVSWQAGPFTGSTSDPLSANCSNTPCSIFTLHVEGTDPGVHKVSVRIDWTSPTNDLDLRIVNSATGGEVISSGASVSTSEQVQFIATPGTYRVEVTVYRAVNESYVGKATLTTIPAEPPITFRTGKYELFDFGFTTDLQLPDQERSVAFINQDVEPEIEVDALGTIYISAIRGTPGGVDFWRSDDGGATFRFLGQPDGARRPNADVPPEGGVGGGDVDIAIGDPFEVVPATPLSPAIKSPGRLYVTSLWLGSATLSISTDRGEVWTPIPFTTAQLDRQWNVARGEKTLYMSLRKLAQIVNAQHDVYVVQSDDGMVFTKGSFVQDPATGVPDDLAGNIVLTSNGTIVGSFISRDGKDLYIYRTPKEGQQPPANLPPGPTDVPIFTPDVFEVGKIFHATGAMTTNNTFPIMTVDQEDNLHIVFCDRTNVYLMSCAAGKNPTHQSNWTKPLPLNAPRVPGFEFTRTTIFPWAKAGKSGNVSVIWYGTDVLGDADSPVFEEQNVPWRIIYAQVENALSDSPKVYLDIASNQGGGIIHRGQICTRGLGCPDGTRELAEYSSVTLDNNGFANIAYTGTIINGVDPEETAAITFFTKSTRKPAIVSPPTTEILSCDDSTVNRAGGWHIVSDDRATDGHYCRIVGAKKNSNAFLQFSYTGTKVDMQIARGPRGGVAEIIIDGVSHGRVDMYRAPSDPSKPDNSGKKDLTFGEFVSFHTGPGQHTFRLNVVNDNPDTKRDMVYVDGFIITNGAPQGTATYVEETSTSQGNAGPLGVLTHPVTLSPGATQVTSVLEVPEGSDLDLAAFDANGVLAAESGSQSLTEVTRVQPIAGSIAAVTMQVANRKPASSPYTLHVITSRISAASKAGTLQPTENLKPAEFALRQNHPNPFNPQTSIEYSIPEDEHVQLKVFTVYGQEVATLVDRTMSPGRYRITFDARSIASGVYYYKLVAGRFSDVKRMVIIK